MFYLLIEKNRKLTDINEMESSTDGGITLITNSRIESQRKENNDGDLVNFHFVNQQDKRMNDANTINELEQNNPSISLKSNTWKPIKSSLYSFIEFNGDYLDILKETKNRLKNKIRKIFFDRKISTY